MSSFSACFTILALSGPLDGNCEASAPPAGISFGDGGGGLEKVFASGVGSSTEEGLDEAWAWIDRDLGVLGGASLVDGENLPPLIGGVKLTHGAETRPIRYLFMVLMTLARWYLQAGRRSVNGSVEQGPAAKTVGRT